jgi:hypothetical protein
VLNRQSGGKNTHVGRWKGKKVKVRKAESSAVIIDHRKIILQCHAMLLCVMPCHVMPCIHCQHLMQLHAPYRVSLRPAGTKFTGVKSERSHLSIKNETNDRDDEVKTPLLPSWLPGSLTG